MLNSVKDVLVKEIEVKDVKEVLIKERDISELKEALTKEITVKDFFAGESNTKVDYSNQRDEESPEEKIEVDLPAYKYGLTDSFKNDNQEILSIFEIIMQLASDKEYATMPLCLLTFLKSVLSIL